MGTTSWLDISSLLGLVATGVLTFNLLLGMLLGTAYHANKTWQKLPKKLRQLNVRTLHNYTAYLALLIALVHPAVLLWDKTVGLSLTDLLYPVNYQHQPLYMTLGSVAFYALLVIVVTSVGPLRRALSFTAWKRIHFASYPLALLFLVHGFFMDPTLKDRASDPLDAEKMLSEGSLLLLAVATYYRVRYQRTKNRLLPRYHRLSVASVTPQTALASSFALTLPADLREQFRYTPGQFLLFKFVIDGQEYKRAYSLSSSPEAGEPLTFTAKRIGNGVVSNYLNDHVAVGATLDVMPPSGTFFALAAAADTAAFFFLAGGSGITPIFSILKSLLAAPRAPRLRLLYANTNEDTIMFGRDLDALAAQHPNRFSMTLLLSKPGPAWQGKRGRITPEIIQALTHDLAPGSLAASAFYVCGPSPFMEVAEHALLALGVGSHQLHAEKFVSLSADSAVLEVGNEPADPALTRSRVTVTLDGQPQQVECAENQTLLAALLAAGIPAPYSCREGFCSTCKATLVKGRVRMAHHDALTDLDVLAGTVLTCQACPLTKETVLVIDAV